MWRFEEGECSFAEAMRETARLQQGRLAYEEEQRQATERGKVKENLRAAEEELRDTQRENARLQQELERHNNPSPPAPALAPRAKPAPRPLTPRSKEAALEEANEKLREQVSRLKSKVIVATMDDATEEPGVQQQLSARPSLRQPRVVDGMTHEQMLREAQLRVKHNKQRQQLKGYLKLSARGGEDVGVDKLQVAARLAGVQLPKGLTDTMDRPGTGGSGRGGRGGVARAVAPGLPWRSVVDQVEYPITGTEEVKRKAHELAARRQRMLSEQEVKEVQHREKVIEQAEDSGITEKELRDAHGKIRDHFATRFKQVRRGFRLLDEDSSGKLSYAELKTIILMFNLNIPGKIVQKIIELADYDGNGTIDYAEFARIMTAEDIVYLKDTLTGDVGATGAVGATAQYKKTAGLKGKVYRKGPAQLRPGVTKAQVRTAQKRLREELEEKYSKLTDAFKFIDSDRTGQLEREELKTMLLEFNIMEVTPDAIDTLIDFADFDGDGGEGPRLQTRA